MALGKNSSVSDIYNFCEQFRVWNFLRYNANNLQLVPDIASTGLDLLFQSFLSYMRNLLSPEEENIGEDEIKAKLEGAYKKIVKVYAQNEREVYRDAHELLVPGFTECSIRIKPALFQKDMSYLRRKQLFVEIINENCQIWDLNLSMMGFNILLA